MGGSSDSEDSSNKIQSEYLGYIHIPLNTMLDHFSVHYVWSQNVNIYVLTLFNCNILTPFKIHSNVFKVKFN